MTGADESLGARRLDPKVTGQTSFQDWKPGDVIADGLEIVDLIGQGGMGVVWRVHHREWNRELAVKMPLPALVGSPTARDRFLREAETWIDLGVHPHIVQCWFVKDISGLPSLFLDFLTGGSLKQWLVAGHIRPGQWKRILEIAIQVAEGLAYAHSRGVVHRDVKPANLLIRGDERVCVTDFGIVKTANDKEEVQSPVNLSQLPKDMSLTGTGAFLGTPQYGAPEQWGAAAGVDQAADIYALGVTLYEMICGRRPFDTDDERTAPEVLIERHLDAKPPDPREFYPDIPSELAHMALLCLEKDPKRRPHDMERLRGALSSIYERLTSSPYRGVGSVPKEQRADILNNRAASLHSLAKPREARDVWRQGLRIESGHPECLFNLTQLELRAGRIDGAEALRRLRQAKAGLPLALLCIEEGEHHEAVQLLEQLKPDDASVALGAIQRALGDARMFTQQYYAAEKAYRSALGLMPADALSHERKRLASLGRRGMGGKILFPSSKSTFHVVLKDPTMKVVIEDNSEGVIGFTESHAIYWDINEQCVEHRLARPSGATAPQRLSTSGSLVLCEDRDSFELRRLPTLNLLGRKSGQILATTKNLRRMFVRDRKGSCVFDVSQSSLQRLHLPDDAEVPLLAEFDHSGERVCLLLQTGQIGQPDEEGEVQPEEWPLQVENYETATTIALSGEGSHLFVGHSNGHIQALNFVERAVVFEVTMESPVKKIFTTEVSRKLVVQMESGYAILNHHGEVISQGSGAVCLDKKRGRVLAYPEHRLELYALSPFRRLRDWADTTDPITEIQLAGDGRRAVSTSDHSHFDVWEVDEDNRVFERSYLLSPGKSFAEIASASKRFGDSLKAAKEALKREDLSTCYRHLKRARSVEGYAQRPEALDLNWQLLSVLRRDKLESVWERVSLEAKGTGGSRPGPHVLVGEAQNMLVTFASLVQLFKDDGSVTTKLWSEECGDKVLLAHVTEQPQGRNPGQALIVNCEGVARYLCLGTGACKDQFRISNGPFNKFLYTSKGLLYLTDSYEVGLYCLRKRMITGRWTSVSNDRIQIHAWRAHSALVAGENQFFSVDLSARNPKPQHIRLKSVENDSGVSFASPNRDEGLLYLGFRNGEVVIFDKKVRPLYQLRGADGPITGFHLLAELSIGVASTGLGKLCFWDVSTGERLEEFSAHRGWILNFQISPSGRYLLTSGTDDQIRLWETSWTASEEEGEPQLPWLVGRKPANKLGRFFGFGG